MQIIVVAALICRDGYSRFGINMRNRGLQPYGSRQLLEKFLRPTSNIHEEDDNLAAKPLSHLQYLVSACTASPYSEALERACAAAQPLLWITTLWTLMRWDLV